jgi:hypothetical protein
MFLYLQLFNLRKIDIENTISVNPHPLAGGGRGMGKYSAAEQQTSRAVVLIKE